MFSKTSVLKIFAKLTGKYPRRSRPETLVRTTPALAYFCDFYKIFLERLFYRTFPGACSIIITWIINFWRFSSNLPDVYLLASWFTLHMFLLYLSSDNDHANNFYSYKVCTLCLLIVKLPPSFLFQINELMQEGEKTWKLQRIFYPWLRKNH